MTDLHPNRPGRRSISRRTTRQGDWAHLPAASQGRRDRARPSRGTRAARCSVLLVLLGALVVPSFAEAHTLTATRAKTVAERAGASLRDIDEPEAEVQSCRRDSRHQFTCAVSAGSMVSRGATLCTLDVVVRFASRRSYRATASRRNVVCTTPGLTDPGAPPGAS